MYLLLLVCRGYIDGSVDLQSLAYAWRFFAFSAGIVGLKNPNHPPIMKKPNFRFCRILRSVYCLQIGDTAVGWIQNGNDARFCSRTDVA